jgi:hypothetical protein
LDGTANNTTFSCPLGLTFANEEATLRTESFATLVAVEAALVPLAANCSGNNIVQNMLLAA